MPSRRVAGPVALYIGAADWFTASTSFASPAAALGRTFSDTFAGISPTSVPAFVVAEVLGGALAALVARGFAAVRQRSNFTQCRRNQKVETVCDAFQALLDGNGTARTLADSTKEIPTS